MYHWLNGYNHNCIMFAIHIKYSIRSYHVWLTHCTHELS